MNTPCLWGRIGRGLRALGVLAGLMLCGQARALTDLAQQKLYGHWTTAPSGFYAGNCVALSDKWALMGCPYAMDLGGGTGPAVVQVYNAATGAWVRKITQPSPGTLNTQFGYAMAINGDYAVIGAFGTNSNTGAAYLYNVATGALVKTYTATGGAAGDNFGSSVAMTGNRVIIGAHGRSSSQGAVYVFDKMTGAGVASVVVGSTGDRFGYSVAAQGNLLLAGAETYGSGKGRALLLDLNTYQVIGVYTQNGAAFNEGACVALSGSKVIVGAPGGNGGRGSVFVYRMANSASFFELKANDGLVGDLFGMSLSADSGQVLVGAAYKPTTPGKGKAYLFDLYAGAVGETRGIVPMDATAVESHFGYSVALCGNTALIGANADASQAPGVVASGAAYLVRPVTVPLTPLTKVAGKGDFAPATPDTSFNVLGDAFINASSHVAFQTSLSGLGSHGGLDNGVWSTLNSSFTLQSLLKSQMTITVPATTDAVVQSVSLGAINENGYAVAIATLKTGSGTPAVTAQSNKALVKFAAGAYSVPLQTGNLVFIAPGNTRINVINDLVQGDMLLADYWVASCALRPEAATGTTASNDSTLIIHDNGVHATVREGNAVPTLGGPLYGQLTGRVANQLKALEFSAAVTGAGTNNQVIMQRLTGGATAVVAQKGVTLPPDITVMMSAPPPAFTGFLGETAGSDDERVLYRATIAGGGITAANNEGLWVRSTSGAQHKLALRKGQIVASGLTVAKIINAWECVATVDAVVALVQLAGTGVTAANDQAVVLVQNDFSLLVMFREGDAAQIQGSGATVGTISRMQVDSYSGYYAIIATLAGAPVGQDLAMYTGYLGAATTGPSPGVRRPELFLRKGILYDNQPGKVKTFSLPTTNIPASGLGGTGRGNAIGWNSTLAITVEFDNGARQIMRGAVTF